MDIEVFSKVVKTLKDIGILCMNINVNMMFIDEKINYDNVFTITFYFNREKMEEIRKWSKIDIDKIIAKAAVKMNDNGFLDYVRIDMGDMAKSLSKNTGMEIKKCDNIVKKIALDTKIDIAMTLGKD